MNISLRVLTAFALLVTQTAIAQVKGSAYLAADVGGSFLLGTSAHTTLLSVPVSTDVEFDPGYRVGLRLGYQMPQGAVIEAPYGQATFNIAVELDAGYVHNSVSSGLTSGVSADFNQVPLLVNVIFSVPVTERFEVGLGFGLGGAITMLTASDSSTEDTSTSFGFAYQGLVNFSYHFNPRLSASVFTKIMVSPDATGPDAFGSQKLDGPIGISAGLGLTYLF